MYYLSKSWTIYYYHEITGKRFKYINGKWVQLTENECWPKKSFFITAKSLKSIEDAAEKTRKKVKEEAKKSIDTYQTKIKEKEHEIAFLDSFVFQNLAKVSIPEEIIDFNDPGLTMRRVMSASEKQLDSFIPIEFKGLVVPQTETAFMYALYKQMGDDDLRIGFANSHYALAKKDIRIDFYFDEENIVMIPKYDSTIGARNSYSFSMSIATYARVAKTIFANQPDGPLKENIRRFAKVSYDIAPAGSVKCRGTFEYVARSGKIVQSECINYKKKAESKTIYMSESVIKDYQKKGPVCLNVPDYSKESVLKKYGYTVNQKDNLSEAQRHTILNLIISEGVLSRERVISYLRWFISGREKRDNMLNACSLWQSDIHYLMKR